MNKFKKGDKVVIISGDNSNAFPEEYKGSIGTIKSFEPVYSPFGAYRVAIYQGTFSIWYIYEHCMMSTNGLSNLEKVVYGVK